ncbi:MAG TPA: short-chain fatty acyl-CoA regulator family protein [Kofleriaceae bacterium]|nr:short-chain fatty acyl-CoA regulator family protein [Kofleriaceae bacterium]
MTRTASPRERASQPVRLGAKVRALRRREGLTQVQLAEQLGVSASYLNLIEANRRPLPANLLIKLAQLFGVDVSAFATDDDARLVADLTEAFADPVLEGYDLTSVDIREVAAASPEAARAVLGLYRAYQTARSNADDLSTQLRDGEAEPQPDGGRAPSHIPSEEVSDYLQRVGNHFPDLETAAEQLAARAKLASDDLYAGLIRYLDQQLRVSVQIAHWEAQRGVLRRYDPERKTLILSELLPTRSRTFQLAHQIAIITLGDLLDRHVADGRFASAGARVLAKVALGNYFAGAVLMPYAAFHHAARDERYDIDVLGRRFRVGFEQVCHRLTTLRRPGAEGVPFHMIRLDVAGNISKRFSASGIRFARFSGVCPRWNVFSAFLTPGMIRIQVSRMPDGNAYFCIARTIQKDAGGYHAQQPVQSIGLGCQIEHARQLVYADGVNLDSRDTLVPVGVTCRLCERTDCDQRAVPSLKVPLHVDENQRGMSLYTAVER